MATDAATFDEMETEGNGKCEHDPRESQIDTDKFQFPIGREPL